MATIGVNGGNDRDQRLFLLMRPEQPPVLLCLCLVRKSKVGGDLFGSWTNQELSLKTRPFPEPYVSSRIVF